jgi:hypothetical protein
MTLDERFAASHPLPTGRPVLYREHLLPILATNDRGQDVTASIQTLDRVAAPPGELDRRFIGRTREHCLTLTFDRPLDQAAGQPVLVFGGWVEYPYSQTMFAAWQAGADYDAPTIEARGADGRWHVLLERFGYMAGMPREASVPLPVDRVPAGTTQLRIRTNLEIYWDRLAVVYAERCDGVIRRQLPLQAAAVREVGFAMRTTLGQRRPDYDYDRLVPLWDTQHQAGFYTRLGPARPLLLHTDDTVALIGPGEEVHLEFDEAPDDLRPGWTRRFVLQTNGWCKDRDLYTRHGETIEPLPRRLGAMAPNPQRRERLHEKFNTRYRSGG